MALSNAVQTHHLIVPGRFDSLAQIAEFIGQAAREAGFNEDEVFHVQMAVDEACSNVVEHAYGPDQPGDIVLTCCLGQESLSANTFVITIRDSGQPFTPPSVPVPPPATALEDWPEGGLGMYFMHTLMDVVHFEFDPDSGNTLTMVKTLGSET
ncbi:MAG: ATP-binding protein [Thermoflexales bacterium]|nr:ATP-binding protein [Thermoflexales bacterium]